MAPLSTELSSTNASKLKSSSSIIPEYSNLLVVLLAALRERNLPRDCIHSCPTLLWGRWTETEHDGRVVCGRARSSGTRSRGRAGTPCQRRVCLRPVLHTNYLIVIYWSMHVTPFKWLWLRPTDWGGRGEYEDKMVDSRTPVMYFAGRGRKTRKRDGQSGNGHSPESLLTPSDTRRSFSLTALGLASPHSILWRRICALHA